MLYFGDKIEGASVGVSRNIEGLISYGLYSYGLNSGLYGYGRCSYGLCTYVVANNMIIAFTKV